MASVSAGAERAAGLRLVPGLTLVLVREVAFGRDLVLAVTVVDFAVLREALFGLAELLGFAAGLAVEALLLAAADFGLAAGFRPSRPCHPPRSVTSPESRTWPRSGWRCAQQRHARALPCLNSAA